MSLIQKKLKRTFIHHFLSLDPDSEIPDPESHSKTIPVPGFPTYLHFPIYPKQCKISAYRIAWMHFIYVFLDIARVDFCSALGTNDGIILNRSRKLAD
jgi:hypothetical protein